MPATVDTWGGAALTVVVAGDDVSCDVLEASVDRSKNRLWDPPDAGVAQVALKLGSDAQPASVGPVGAAVTVAVTYGATSRVLFTGEVQRRRLEADPQRWDRIILDCVDGFERLARVNVRAAAGDTPVGGGDTPAQRIARWLDEADWDPLLTALDPTSVYTCPATLIDGNVLRQIQVAALADGGDFFMSGDGVATFLTFPWRTTGGTVAAVLSDRNLHDWTVYSAAALHDDLDEVQNHVVGTRRDDGSGTPVEQLSENTGSVTLYGTRGDALDELELADDTQVADRVTALVAIAGLPNPRFDAISVQPAADPAGRWPRIIPVTYGSLVAANRVWADGTENAYYGHVIGEQWRFTPVDATVTYRVSGTGTWDAHSPPRPPICVEIVGGLIHVCPGTPCDDTSEVIFRDADGDPIGDPLPPGSLCGDGVTPPDGAVEVCYVNDYGVACVPITDPRLSAVLWLDARNPDEAGSYDMIERIDGDHLTNGPGFDHTDIDAIPGSYDAIVANVDGGLIAADHSDHVVAASWNAGWTVDFWYLDATGLNPTTYLIDLGNIVVSSTRDYDVVSQLEIIVYSAGAVAHLTGPLADIPTDADWHHWVITWSADSGGILTVYLDGVEV